RQVIAPIMLAGQLANVAVGRVRAIVQLAPVVDQQYEVRSAAHGGFPTRVAKRPDHGPQIDSLVIKKPPGRLGRRRRFALTRQHPWPRCRATGTAHMVLEQLDITPLQSTIHRRKIASIQALYTRPTELCRYQCPRCGGEGLCCTLPAV